MSLDTRQHICYSGNNEIEKGIKMVAKIYKRTDASMDIPCQDKLLLSVISPDAVDSIPVYFNEQRAELVRSTRRTEKDTIYCASLALFADDEKELEAFLKAIKLRGHKIVCAKESLTWPGTKPIGIIKAQWKEARKHGAAMRGAAKSAVTKKARTAAALALIYDKLLLPSKGDNTTEKLCSSVGVSRNSIKNHYGFCREELRRKHEIIQQRKERRNAKR